MPRESKFSFFITKTKRRILKNYTFVRRGLVLVVAAIFLLGAVVVLRPLGSLAKDFFFGPVSIFSVIAHRDEELKNDNGRTNILLLGIGDAGHDGPNLTDTMIVLSIQTKFDKPETVKLPPIVMISIPRDIYSDSLGDKINAAYNTGQNQNPPAGLVLAKGVVSEITGLPIHYAIRGNFSVFKKAVDLVGGVDINVEHSFDDYQYPIDGHEADTCGYSVEEASSRAATIVDDASAAAAFPCRYEHLHFDAGLQHMDGATALKFVRSRHAEGDEGSDFARSRRQQLVLSAIKSKVFSAETLLNPTKILDLYNQFKTDIDTDVDPSEIGAFLKVALRYRNAQIKNVALDETYLTNPPIDQRGWILLPNGGNWDQVHEFIQSQLESQ